MDFVYARQRNQMESNANYSTVEKKRIANEKTKDNEQKQKKNHIHIAEGKLRKQMNDSNANK